MADPMDLTSLAAIVEGMIELADERGDGTGLASLRQDLRSALAPPRNPMSARASEQAIADLMLKLLRELVSEALLPGYRDAVIEELKRSAPEGSTLGPSADVWVDLDPDGAMGREDMRAIEILRAQERALRACHRYERTRRTAYLRDAVRHLAQAARVLRTPLVAAPAPAIFVREGARLAGALRDVLPASACRYVLRIVARLIRDRQTEINVATASATRELSFIESDWLEEAVSEIPAEGTWFIEAIQDGYERWASAERRKADEEERQRNEADREMREWSRRRNEALARAEGSGLLEPEGRRAAAPAHAAHATPMGSPDGRSEKLFRAEVEDRAFYKQYAVMWPGPASITPAEDDESDHDITSIPARPDRTDALPEEV